MSLGEAVKRARYERDHAYEPSDLFDALTALIDAVEETLLAQKKEADVILDLASLRRWGGCE